ncbi:MAG: DUF5615 family PIN-like protein [Myxococcales bacterium]|nr:DUF5615 family PIN-like protein [Myxococcales bacterium]
MSLESPAAPPRAKLDENLGRRGADLLRAGGWDVDTVSAEDLCGADDRTLVEVCRAEARVLVSLDKDFANTLRFPPRRYAGIVVLRLPEPLQREVIEGALRRMLEASAGRSLSGRLWIIDARRIREFAEPDDP